MNEIVIARIRHCLKKLEDPRTRQTERLMCWRLIRSSADDAHEAEVRQVDELSVVHSDPIVQSLTGVPVV